MKLLSLSLLLTSASAFLAPAPPPRAGPLQSAMSDLEDLAAASNPVLKFYDPLGLSKTTLFEETNDATIAFLRHAEIKHGRVAMFAFVGYLVQANGIHFPFPIQLDGGTYPFDAGSPPEQWDALSDAAKVQILGVIGFLEWFGEANGAHYMRGGKPGAYPDFKAHPDVVPHPVPFNLYDPLGWSKKASPEKKARGLVSELNNGRLAMFGILGFLAEQKVDGAVPLLKAIGFNQGHYAGEVMAPFA